MKNLTFPRIYQWWKPLIFIYSYFAVDCFLENFYRLYEWWNKIELPYQEANDMWNACLAIRCTLPYIAFLVIRKFFPFDLFDRLIIFLMFLFALIDSLDWFWNFNQRNDGEDWSVFITLNVIILLGKYFFTHRDRKE